MLRQGDRAESAGIRFERQVGQAVDEGKFVLLVLDTGAEVHAEFHIDPSRRFFLSNRGQSRLLPQVTAHRVSAKTRSLLHIRALHAIGCQSARHHRAF
jgi:hypothetical protein